jgi:hypothetical protein
VDEDETNDDRKDTSASLTCISLQWPLEKKQTEEAGRKEKSKRERLLRLLCGRIPNIDVITTPASQRFE